MAHIRGKLQDIIQMLNLPRCIFVSTYQESVNQWFEVSNDHELSTFDKVAEMFNGLINHQEFLIALTVFLLSSLELLEMYTIGHHCSPMSCCKTAPKVVPRHLT